MKTYNKRMDGTKVLFGAHRGDQLHFPENTMAAMKATVELGCDMIETDVRMTKDGYLVLIHDRDVKRTTNGSGFVDEMTLEEIRALDAGSWKAPEFAGMQIPTVEEFLEYISQTDVMINWELKEYPGELGERAFVCADKLVEMIKKYGMVERSMMNSFSEQILEHFYDTYPGEFVIHGYIDYKPAKDFASKPLESFLDWAAIWHKSAENPAGFKEDYTYAIERDILTCILVPDTEEMYQKALDLGCRMFTSNDPAAGIEILRKLGLHN